MSGKVIYHFDENDNVTSSIYDGEGELKDGDSWHLDQIQWHVCHFKKISTQMENQV